MFTLDVKKVVERSIQLNQQFNEKMLVNMLSSRNELAEMIKRMEERGEEVGEHWGDDFSEESMFVLDASELLLVSLYHSTERYLKLILRWAKPGIAGWCPETCGDLR